MIKNKQTVRENKKKACEISKKNKLPITRIHTFQIFKKYTSMIKIKKQIELGDIFFCSHKYELRFEAIVKVIKP